MTTLPCLSSLELNSLSFVSFGITCSWIFRFFMFFRFRGYLLGYLCSSYGPTRKTPPIYLDYIRVPVRTTLQNCRLLVPSSWQHVLRDDHLAWFHRCPRAWRSIGAGLCMTPSLCRTCQLNKTSPAIDDDTRANTSIDLPWNSISNCHPSC